jgi:hypothetical protein
MLLTEWYVPPEPSRRFPRVGTADRHRRGQNERDAGRDIGDPDADRHALR